MELWDLEFIDMEVPGFIKIQGNGSGEFHFGAVTAQCDGRVIRDGDEVRFEFTWSDWDDCDAASCRLWAMLRDGELHGRFYFHLGDNSAFIASRSKQQ